MGLFDFFKKKEIIDNGYSKPINYSSLDNIEIPKPHVMHIKPAGVTFENRQDVLKKIYSKQKPFDKRLDLELIGVDFEGELAIEVKINGYMIGYVPKNRINEFVKHKDFGYKIKRIYTGYHEESRTYYCDIKIEFAK